MQTGRIRAKQSPKIDCLIILVLNFFGNVWALLSRFMYNDTETYKRLLQDNFNYSVDVFLTIVGGWIYLAAIILIIFSKPTIRSIKSSFIVSLLDALYMLIAFIRITADDDTKEKYMILEHANERILSDERESLDSYYAFLAVMYLLLIITLAFKLYSALVIYHYERVLERSLVHDTHAPQNHSSTEAAPSATSACNTQETAPQLHPHPPQYPHQPHIPPGPAQQSSTPLLYLPYDSSRIPQTQSPSRLPSQQGVHQRLDISSSPSRFPHNSSTVTITQSPTLPPKQYLNQPLGIPSNRCEHPSGPASFPYNSSNVLLTLPDKSSSQRSQFPYQASNIPFGTASESDSKSARFPYNAPNIALSLYKQ